MNALATIAQHDVGPRQTVHQPVGILSIDGITGVAV